MLSDDPTIGYGQHPGGTLEPVDGGQRLRELGRRPSSAANGLEQETRCIISQCRHPAAKGVLVDTRVGDSPMMLLAPEEQKKRSERTLQKRSIWESREIMYTAYRDRRAFKTWTDEVFGDYIEGATRPLRDGRAELKCHPQVEETFYQDRRELDTSKVLRGLGGEYILLVGDYKGAQTPQDPAVRHLTRETKGFQLKELGAGSHFVPMEYPDLVLKEIRNFIDRA